MQDTMLALLRQALDGGITVSRAVFHVGRATIQVVVKIAFGR